MTLLVLILATWRLSSLLVSEDGPADVFAKIRMKAGVRYDEYSNAYGTNVVSQALTCVWCTSVWVGLFWAILYLVSVDVSFYMALPFGLSGGAILINQFVKK